MDGISDAELQLAAALRGIPSEQALIQQRMRRAQGLMDSPLPQGQMVGRVYRASSPLETLAAALNRYQGATAMKTAEGQYQDLTARANQASQAQARIDMAEKERGWRFRQDEFGLKQDAERRQAEAAAAAAKNAAAAQAEAARHNAAGEAQARAALEQDAWAFGQDATGGGFMYNRKTGQIVPVSPNGTMPGSGTGLKPDQFESDVQAYGKDMEDLSKIQTDLATLREAAKRGDVAGFGPAAGRVPGMLTSEEAVANRQAAARIMAGIIKMTSGQAASEAEVNRLLEANGLGRTATDAQFREGVNKLVAQYDDLAKQRSAKYAPQVVKTYEARGGFTGPKARVDGSAPALSPEDAKAKAWAESNPNDPRAAQILQRLKAKGL